jgi:hypothetical protein
MRSNGFVFLALVASGCTFMTTEPPVDYYSGDGPSITGLDIASEHGNIGGGTVNISGSGFGTEAGKIVVLFGTNNADILSVTDTNIEALVPAGPVSCGKVAVTVATADNYFVFGDDEGESGYIYDAGPTYEDDSTAETIYDNENAYVVLQNYKDINWDVWVGMTGIDAYGEFLEFAYPRYHTQDIGIAVATDQGPADDWVVQTPGLINYIMGLEDLRLEVNDFVVYNHDNAGVQDWVDAMSLEPARPDDQNKLTYDVDELHVCQEPYKDTRDKHRYSAEWPVSENFFWTDNEDDTVDITIDFAPPTLDEEGKEIDGDTKQAVKFSDNSTAVDLRLPPQMIVTGTEGFKGGTSEGAWTLSQSGVGTFTDCFDDADDDDRETTLDDTALRWEWEPIPSSFYEHLDTVIGNGPILDVKSYVRVTINQMSIGWIGGESYPIRTTIVVPDDNDYDEETGMSSVEMPMDIFYQFPTSDVFSGGTDMMGNPTYDDPTDPRWGYSFVSVDRITEYRLESYDAQGMNDPDAGVGLQGDLVVAYATGDFGLFSWVHPLDSDDSCADCVDNDGDGWVDDDDPDCDDDNRPDDSEPAEDGAAEGLFTCNDGVDNDEDGLIDWEDEDCEAGDELESNCDDGEDNDGDGWEDELDGECMEANGVELGNDSWGCSNGIDDDGDNWIDVDDPDCTDGQAEELGFGDSVCNNGLDDDGHGDIDGADPYCYYSSEGAAGETEQPEMTSECIDGEDNDEDGYIDANDPDCETGSYYRESREFWESDFFDLIPACYNGEDDDGDGQIDALDPGCYGDGGDADGFIDSEEDPILVTACENTLDDDGDGWIDADDPDCAAGDEELGFGTTQCNNGVDDDKDKLTDADDAECADASDDDEAA